MNGFAWDWNFVWSVVPSLLAGAKLTVIATFFGSIVSFVLGLVWAVVRLTRIRLVAPAVGLFIEFVRGTPLLVQLYFLFYVLPTWGLSLPAFITGILGLGLFYSASTAEIYRGGIEELPSGQWEAALTLGLPLRRVWFGVVLPQAIGTVWPMLGNQVVSMFKETALLSTITVLELLAQAKNIGSIEFRYIEPLTMAAAFYLVISYGAVRMLRRFETRNALHG